MKSGNSLFHRYCRATNVTLPRPKENVNLNSHHDVAGLVGRSWVSTNFGYAYDEETMDHFATVLREGINIYRGNRGDRFLNLIRDVARKHLPKQVVETTVYQTMFLIMEGFLRDLRRHHVI